jgi:hypothetical protein
MSDEKQTDLQAMIGLLRAGGVFHAEFYEDGSPKIITLGPDPSAGGGDTESDDAPKKSALREHARRLQFGKRVA